MTVWMMRFTGWCVCPIRGVVTSKHWGDWLHLWINWTRYCMCEDKEKICHLSILIG